MTQESDRVQTRNRNVLEAAFALAQERGFRNFNRRAVAERAGVAVGGINHAFGTMADLHDAVMRAAVERHTLSVIATGLVLRHPAALAAPQELKDSALASLAA